MQDTCQYGRPKPQSSIKKEITLITNEDAKWCFIVYDEQFMLKESSTQLNELVAIIYFKGVYYNL